ncbi:hypothetical protein ACLOJK_025326 [Asimina triloba]
MPENYGSHRLEELCARDVVCKVSHWGKRHIVGLLMHSSLLLWSSRWEYMRYKTRRVDSAKASRGDALSMWDAIGMGNLVSPLFKGSRKDVESLLEARVDPLYLPKIFEQFTSAEGFLFLQDDTILNYWNLLQADKTKLWITDKVAESWMSVSIEANSSTWFSSQAELVNYKASMDEKRMILCASELFYVPRHFFSDFIDLVGLVGDLELHHKIAVPMFFMAMDLPGNFEDVFRTMIYQEKLPSNASSSFYSAEVPAVHPWNVLSESDFVKLIRIMAAGDPLLMEMV